MPSVCLYTARASLAAWISRSCPVLGSVPLPSRKSILCQLLLLLPWLMLQRASDVFAWQKFSLDGAGTAIIHHRPVTSSCCLWIYRGTVQDLSVLNLLGSISLFLRPINPLLALPSTSENPVCGAHSGTKETASIKTGKTPAPLEGLAFSICQ